MELRGELSDTLLRTVVTSSRSARKASRERGAARVVRARVYTETAPVGPAAAVLAYKDGLVWVRALHELRRALPSNTQVEGRCVGAGGGKLTTNSTLADYAGERLSSMSEVINILNAVDPGPSERKPLHCRAGAAHLPRRGGARRQQAALAGALARLLSRFSSTGAGAAAGAPKCDGHVAVPLSGRRAGRWAGSSGVRFLAPRAPMLERRLWFPLLRKVICRGCLPRARPQPQAARAGREPPTIEAGSSSRYSVLNAGLSAMTASSAASKLSSTLR